MFPNGPFGNMFPYSNFHGLNLDWVIQIAKDFLDQYTGIQQLISTGIENIDSEAAAKIAEIDAKAEHIQQLLDEWYETHSADIANELTRALAEATTAFNDAATAKAIEVMETIPADYTALAQSVSDMSKVIGYTYLDLEFTAGFVSAATLAIQTTSPGDHLLSDTVQIPANVLLYVPKISRSSNCCLLTETDAEGTPIRMILRGSPTTISDGSYVIVPITESGYYRFGGNTQMTNYMNYYYKSFTKDTVFDLSNYSNWNSYPVEYETRSGPIIEGGVTGGDQYLHSTPIILTKGMTLEFWSAGSASNLALSECSGYSYDYIAPLVRTDAGIIHQKYTAPRSMFVRFSGRVYAGDDNFSAVCPPEKFASWKIYKNDLHYENIKNSTLYQKNLTVMGDSLVAGNHLRQGPTWVTNIGIKYDMNYTNLGINGNTMAIQDTETSNPPMVNRVNDIPLDTDLLVIQAGANDKRLNVPLGSVDSEDPETFMGAINVIIDRIYARCPKVKIIFATTHMRFTSLNSLGLGDEDYAEAMLTVANNRLIPCFDMFHKSGVNFTNTYQDAWMDENNNYLKEIDNVATPSDPTHHFSIEGYEWITPLYEEILKAGTGS